tara:strand:+ start:956 stop:1213 length:258 start_codon:yes stop_codon:yes gene_type:complete
MDSIEDKMKKFKVGSLIFSNNDASWGFINENSAFIVTKIFYSAKTLDKDGSIIAFLLRLKDKKSNIWFYEGDLKNCEIYDVSLKS